MTLDEIGRSGFYLLKAGSPQFADVNAGKGAFALRLRTDESLQP